jgi:hypothetical protein
MEKMGRRTEKPERIKKGRDMLYQWMLCRYVDSIMQVS